MYKAILFDLDGTLLDFHACETNALKETLSLLGLPVNDEKYWVKVWKAYKPISSAYWKAFFSPSNRTQANMTRDQVIEASIRDTLLVLKENLFDEQFLGKEYWRVFCQTAYLNPGAKDILEKLKPRYLLGIITNGYSRAQHGRIEASGLIGYLDLVIVSDDVGHEKPDPQIFRIALSKLEISEQEALYIGDSIEHDYYGTKNAGIDFCYYQPKTTKSGEDPEIAPKYIIRSFKELEWLIPNLKGK
ncbi:MAG: YjjG family noncanonical pyrimidine nucleotidase [Candidatus Hodarchaeota archaeon]